MQLLARDHDQLAYRDPTGENRKEITILGYRIQHHPKSRSKRRYSANDGVLKPVAAAQKTTSPEQNSAETQHKPALHAAVLG
jgi:hypothetical protein